MTSPLIPHIELVPLQAAIAQDQSTTLDLLIQIVPPIAPVQLNRPPLNLGLAIDRSGSMSGSKIEYARQAACYAVQQLLPSDRVSVTIFDTQVATIVASTTATEKDEILRKIRGISAGSSTALHAGWVEAGIQVGQHLHPKNLNRVLLLSDGLANVGETNPDAIASDVHGLAQRGISTTTMGVGNDYSEDLLEAMARSGDGNFYHIESPQQLPDIFQSELQGLMATIGHTVSLGITPQNQVTVVDVLNDLDKTQYGRLKLPNLVVGNPIAIVVRLKVPPLSQSIDLCHFRLAWNDPTLSGRQVIHATLRLPVVSAAQMREFPPNPDVQQQVALLMAARARQEAVQYLDRGDIQSATMSLQNAVAAISVTPASPITAKEAAQLTDLEAEIRSGNLSRSRKKAVSQRYNRLRSREDR